MPPGDPLEDTRDWSAEELEEMSIWRDEQQPPAWVYGFGYELMQSHSPWHRIDGDETGEYEPENI